MFVENTVRGLAADRSALFLHGEAIDWEQLHEGLKPYGARVLQTRLAKDQGQELREALAQEEYGALG